MLLNKGWKIREVGKSNYIDATVPGSVFYDYIKNGLTVDPYYRDNEYKVYELAKKDYEYFLHFTAPKNIFKYTKQFLVFNGLDTLAKVYLNGKLILTADNMHRRYKLDVGDSLQKNNELKVLFSSPVKYCNDKQKEYFLPAFTVPENGFTHLRKAHYSFGWDWAANLPDIGIWRNVELYGADAEIDDVKIEQKHLKNRVDVKVKIKLNNYTGKDYKTYCSICSPDGDSVVNGFFIDGDIETCFKIDNPRLWWCNGLGKQSLYDVMVDVFDGEIKVATFKKKIGLREIVIKRQNDNYGQSFTVSLNGVDVFIKGADYIPEDSIIGFTNKKRTEQLIKDAVKANFNALRVWGGGYYYEDYFYDLCDKYGILLWQDLMFACGTYKFDKAFKDTVTEEVKDNVKRLRHHPSIALWCGNNELEMFFSEHRYGDIDGKLESDYYAQFDAHFTKLINSLDDRLYWQSSPSSGDKTIPANDESFGDMHYWGVWHEKADFTAYRKYFPRFMSEFGIESYPSMKTIKSFTIDADRGMYTPIMQGHQKNPAGNELITYYIRQNYDEPKDFEEAIYLSQLIQAEGLRYGVEHFRRNRGRCMGAIYWQLNDCWQSASWSSIDYFLRWKALHYFAKRFYAPILLSCEEEGLTAKLVVTNDTLKDFSGKAVWCLKTTCGNTLKSGIINVTAKKLSAVKVDKLDFSDLQINPNEVYLEYKLFKNKTEISGGTVLFAKAKDFKFIKPDIKTKVKKSGKTATLQISSNVFVKAVELDLKDYDVVFSDNFFDLSADELKTVKFKTELSKKEIESQLTIKYLTNKNER